MIFNNWRLANPNNPKNIRKRSAILIEEINKQIFIDAGPDIRSQVNEYNIKNLDAVLLTHGHYDHISGIPELPRASKLLAHPIDIYSSAETMIELQNCFGYLFHNKGLESYEIRWKPLPDIGDFDCCDIKFKTFQVPHHQLHCSAFRCNNFAYVTNWEDIPQKGLDILQGVELLIIECNNGLYPETNGHSDLKKIKKITTFINIKKVVLSHLSAQVDYDELSRALPNDSWIVGYDGLKLEI